MNYRHSHTAAAILPGIFAAIIIASCLLISCRCELNPAAHPKWFEQGPGPIISGQVEGMEDRPVAGAVKSIAPHPRDQNIIYIATVNGGVWKTSNAYDDFPEWVPLTDHLPSLAIGCIAFSPLDENFNTLFAGTGSFSSGARAGGPAIGIYKTGSGGFVWETIGQKDLAGIPIREIIPAAVEGNVAGEPILLVATTQGIFRSIDAGANFNNVLAGNVTSLVGDPNNASQFFAAIPGQGVFRSTDAGATWQATAAINDPVVANAVSAKLAVSRTPEPGGSPLYAAFSQASSASVWRSASAGDSWNWMGTPTTKEPPVVGTNIGPFPGGQSAIHFSLAADPESRFLVYLGGDRQPVAFLPNSSGTGDFSGRLFWGDFSKPAGQMWAPMVGAGAGGTSPHADSRDMKFDALGNLLEADDGGIYRLSVPSQPTERKWSSVNGNLRITEFYRISYDSHNNVIFGGTQDVGSVEQVLPVDTVTGAFLWRDARLFGFNIAGFNVDLITQEGDGGFVGVDNQTQNNASIRYTMGNNLNLFFRRDYSTPSPAVVPGWLNFAAEGNPLPFSGLHTQDQGMEGFRLIPFAVNAVEPASLVIGANAIYESRDFGVSVSVVGQPRRGRIVDAIAYGSRNPEDRSDRVGVIYAARGNELSIRPTFTVDWNRRFIGDTLFSSAGNKIIRDMVIDSDNWRRAYLVTQNRVYRIENATEDNEAVIDLTGDLSNFSAYYDSISNGQRDIDLRCVELFKSEEGMSVLLVGGMGGVFRLRHADLGTPGGVTPWLWEEFGILLPNVLVRDIHYDRTDDILIAGTWGRGAWTILNASESLTEPRFIVKSGQVPRAVKRN